MNIMFLHSSMQAGGAERMISALANHYAEQGIEVSIAVIDDLPSFYPLHPKVQLLNLWKFQKSGNIWQALKNNLTLISRTRQTFKEIHPDCIICFGINSLVHALVANIFLQFKVIGSERNNPGYDNKGFWNSMKRIATPFADGYIFQTIGARKYYPRIVQKNSEVIPNGIYIENMLADIVPLGERIPDSICAVGRLHYQKDYDNLLNAFAGFLKNFPSYTLVIFGEGGERGRLEKLIHDLELQAKVILAGRISNIAEEISQRKIYILSSRFEGMPNALMEGMACGCACISTDCDYGPRELISDGENGLLVPIEDPAALAAAMQKLATDSDLLEKIARNAVNIRQTHSIEQVADSYLEYIKTIIQK